MPDFQWSVPALDTTITLPPHMCTNMSEAGRFPALDHLIDWIFDQRDSNLIVVYGDVGQGKTFLLNEVVKDAKSRRPDSSIAPIDFESFRRVRFRRGERVTDGPPESCVLVVDNFDALNAITDEQTSPPDVRDLVDALVAGYRIMVATRRSARDTSDELNRQLHLPIRHINLSVKNPQGISLDVWTISELTEAAESSGSANFRAAVDYLGEGQTFVSSELRRPLTLQMIIRAIGPVTRARRVPSIAELYDLYAEWVLTVDYDKGRSKFRESHKRQILTNIAYDIFSGQRGTYVNTYSASYVRLSERVMETVSQDPMLRRASDTRSLEWTHDFIQNNHFLWPTEASFPLNLRNREYTFVHPSFYEYFVAQGILRRIAFNSSLGIRPGALSEATFRSMIMYFVREYWSAAVEQAIGSIAHRNLQWPDRLLLLNTMETSDEFGQLIRDTDVQYFDDLSNALRQVRSHFIQKAIMYQLVIAGRYAARDYIAEARDSEGEAEMAEERRLLGSHDIDVTTALVKRLGNRNLAAALPITVFRLGQLGSPAAVGPLTKLLREGDCDTELRSLIVEALDRISDRAAVAASGAEA